MISHELRVRCVHTLGELRELLNTEWADVPDDTLLTDDHDSADCPTHLQVRLMTEWSRDGETEAIGFLDFDDDCDCGNDDDDEDDEYDEEPE